MGTPVAVALMTYAPTSYFSNIYYYLFIVLSPISNSGISATSTNLDIKDRIVGI